MTAVVILSTITVVIGGPILLTRGLTSRRGQRFLRWCLHWDDDA